MLAAAILILGGTTVCGYLLANRYRTTLEYSYRRALGDLETSISSMETALSKSRYANTITQQNSLSALLMRESAAAKSALAVLPIRDGLLDKVSRFVAQVGDYSMSLSQKVTAGKTVSEEEYETLTSLGDYAARLKEEIIKAVDYFSDGRSIGEAERVLDNITAVNASALGDAFESTAEQLSDFPTLLYDGPFSDHIGQKEPLFLKGKKPVDEETAAEAAAKVTGLSHMALTHTGDSGGGMPLYNFTADGLRVSVTKAGGFPVSMLRSRASENRTLSEDDALKKARAFLEGLGIRGMKERYYAINDHICTFNFAYSDGELTYYPDLIKVSVALDDGEIIKYEATGYAMNHHDRGDFTVSLTIEEAERKVSPHLTVQKREPVVIPTPALDEVCCYEFLCEGLDGEQVLVYINTETGLEENILILLQSDDGVLAK